VVLVAGPARALPLSRGLVVISFFLLASLRAWPQRPRSSGWRFSGVGGVSVSSLSFSFRISAGLGGPLVEVPGVEAPAFCFFGEELKLAGLARMLGWGEVTHVPAPNRRAELLAK
jgi:hypothetical protein